MLAPIVLFIYNRPQHLALCLESLVRNQEFSDSPLFIFADGPKIGTSEAELAKIKAARNIAKSVAWTNHVQIKERTENMGLAASVIAGVSDIIEQYGKVIVLEDDLIVGKHFLKYMNTALVKYQKEDQVMQISGFQFPIDNTLQNEAIFLPFTTTWGWATWQRVWNKIDFYPRDANTLLNDDDMKNRFDLNGSYPYTKMLIRQMKNNQYGSWGIRFWWSVFKFDGVVLYPNYALVQHSDYDFSGTHKSDYNSLNTSYWLKDYEIIHFQKDILINNDFLYKFYDYSKKKKFRYTLYKSRLGFLIKVIKAKMIKILWKA